MEDLVHVPRLKLRTSRAWLLMGFQSVMLPCVCLCGDVGFFFLVVICVSVVLLSICVVMRLCDDIMCVVRVDVRSRW